MRIYAWKELKWKANKLMLGRQEQCRLTPYKSKYSENYIGFKIRWPDNTYSKDHYNLTWAKENAHAYTLSRLNSQETACVGPPSELKQVEAISIPRSI